MKGKIMLGILETMGNAAVGISDMFEAYLRAGYGASYGKLEYEKGKAKRRREKRRDEYEIREKFRKFVYKLERDGLIEKRKQDRFVLTLRGKSKRDELEEKGVKFSPG